MGRPYLGAVHRCPARARTDCRKCDIMTMELESTGWLARALTWRGETHSAAMGALRGSLGTDRGFVQP